MHPADCGTADQFLSVSGSIEFTDKCQADRLVLNIRIPDPQKNLSKTFCGEFSWMAKIPSSTEIDIEFKSNDQIELGGFKLDFQCEELISIQEKEDYTYNFLPEKRTFEEFPFQYEVDAFTQPAPGRC